MRFLLNLGLCSSLLWAAVGCCCCPDPCGNSCGGYGYPTSYNYGTNYNSLVSDNYSTTAQSTSNSNYLASNQSNYSATSGTPTVLPQHNGTAYTQQGTNYTQQGMNAAQQYSAGAAQFNNLCPCESNSYPTGSYFQDANGNPIPMEGMVYDASVVPNPMMTVPATTTSTQEAKPATPAKPGALIPAPQAQLGYPTGTDGQPLVPPAE